MDASSFHYLLEKILIGRRCGIQFEVIFGSMAVAILRPF
jgi:hypothetical protein